MIAELNRNDSDNIRLAVDKMKGENFDAARKMEALLDAYERQNGDDSEAARLREEIEALPGFAGSAGHLEHLKSVSDMLDRANTAVSKWADSNDDEPLDEAVERLVAIVDGPNAKAEKLEKVLGRIIAVVDHGESDALVEVRNLAVDAL